VPVVVEVAGAGAVVEGGLEVVGNSVASPSHATSRTIRVAAAMAVERLMRAGYDTRQDLAGDVPRPP